MDPINSLIFIGSILLIVSIFTSLIAFRFGAPLLLIFLGVGLLAGEDGVGILFNDASTAYLIGSVALALILFESGFDTRLHSFRSAAGPALALATVGVVITTGVVGAAAHYLLRIGWMEAFLLGAIVSSTDAAAVFFLLRVGGITVRERVRSTLEIESGSNDPMAIFLTIALAEMVHAGAAGPSWHLLLDFVWQMGGGAVCGLGGGALIVLAINRSRLEADLYPLVSLSLALFIFAGTSMLGASGFLAVYLAGLTAGNTQLRGTLSLRRFHNGLTWLAQIVMFVMLGLLAAPSQFPALFPAAVGLTLVLSLVARPAAIWLCLLPFRFTASETTFIAWVGLRGAVSILLAIVPILNDLPNGSTYFNIAFLMVVVSLLVQGWTLRPLAHRLGLIVPPRTGTVERVELELPGEVNYELLAYTIQPDSPVARGQPLPRWARPSLIIRHGRVPSVRSSRQLQAGDQVYLFASPSRVVLLDKLFAGSRRLAEDDREFYGDLVLKPDIAVATVAEMYGLPLALSHADRSLHELFEHEFHGAYEVGDRLRMGSVELIVRDVNPDGAINAIGLALEPPTRRPAMAVMPRPEALLQAARRWWGRRAFRRWQKRQRREP